MEAVILAGGLGTRLRPLTLTLPKPLVPIGNVPIVRRIIDKLPRDVTKVVLAVNYKVDVLRKYFRENDCGREVVLVEEKEALGTGGAVKNVEREVNGPFFVFNGDILDSLDLEAFRAFHRTERAACAISLWKVRDPRHYGVVAMDDHRITRFVEKPATKEEAPSMLANAGTYLLDPEVFDAIPSGRPVSIERETFPALIDAEKRVVGYPFTGYWVDVGRPESFLKANETILRHEKRPFALAEGVTDRGADLADWCSVGRGSTLGASAEVARSVLLEDVAIGENAAVRDSILGRGVRIESDAVVVDCVLAEGALVRKGVLAKNVLANPGEVVGEAEDASALPDG